MTRDAIRAHCLKMPGATENVQWGDDLVFKVAGKMFAVVNLETGNAMSFKCSPYLARAHWVCLESLDALPAAELKKRLAEAWELVIGKLPKKTREGLGQAGQVIRRQQE